MTRLGLLLIGLCTLLAALPAYAADAAAPAKAPVMAAG
jgi:hypothetical protein